MASNNIARLGVILGLDTAEFTASIDKAISENRKLGHEMKRSTQRALEDAKNLKYATEDYGKTLTKVQELERNIAEGRYKGAAQGNIDELRRRAAAYDAVAVSATKANKLAEGMTPQQRMGLMYQTTDFFTQIASGQNVMIAALQQGGQLKDQMGGLGNMFRLLGTILTPVRIALGSVAAIFGVLAFQIFKGKQEFDDLNKSIALTGNYAGVTAHEVLAMSRSLSAASHATVSESKVVYDEMLKSGQFTRETFTSTAAVIQKYAELSGLSQKEAAGKLIPSLDGSASSAKKLNDQFNFLTLAQYKHIESLAAQGKKVEAIIEINTLLKDSWKGLSTELGHLDKALKETGKIWDNFWKNISSFGVPESVDVQIATLNKLLVGVQANIGLKEKAAKDRGLPTLFAKEIAEGKTTITYLEGRIAKLIEQGKAEVEKYDAAIKKADEKKTIDDYAAVGGVEKARALTREIEQAKADVKYQAAMEAATELQKIDIEAQKKTADMLAEINSKPEKERRVFQAQYDALVFEKQQAILAERDRKRTELQRRGEKELADSRDRMLDQLDEFNLAYQKEYDAAKQTAIARTESLQLTNDELRAKMLMIGMTTEEIELEKIRLEYAKKIADVERKPISDAQKAMELAHLAQQQRIEEAGVAIKKTMKDIGEYSESVWNNISSAIDNFVKTGKLSFKDFARSIIQDLIAIQLKASARSLFGTFLQSFAGGTPTGMSAADVGAITGVGHAADGGYIEGPTVVGERGPELFIPRTAGTIIPNHAMAKVGSTTNVTNYNIQAIDTKSFEDRILGSSKAVWAANAYGAKNLALGRGRT